MHRLLALCAVLCLMLSPALLPTSALAGLDDGIMAHWPLDGDGRDLGPYGLMGYVKGATPMQNTAGRSGMAIHLSGGDDAVEVVLEHPLDPRALTVAAWIKPERSSQWARIVDKYDHANHAGWNLHVENGILAGFEFWNQAGEHQSVTATTRLTQGQWHHVAATWDGSVARIYVDGVLDNESQATGLINVASKMLTLGNGHDGYNSWPYTGGLDEVRLYSRALSPAEVQALAMSPDPGGGMPGGGSSGGTPGGGWNPGSGGGSGGGWNPGSGGGSGVTHGCSCMDTDHDGVPDAWDGCPGTPPGAFTDPRGCEQGR